MIMSNGKKEEDKEQINKLTIKKDGVQPDPSQKMHLPKKERYQDTSQLRRHTAYWVMVVVSEWLLAVICLIILTGRGELQLDKTVLITLLGTTTINILGLPFVLLQGLYYKPTNNKKK